MNLTRKRTWAGLIALSVLGLTVATACGSADTPAAPAGAAVTPISHTNSVEPGAQVSPDAQGPQVVTIVATDSMRFSPSAISIRAGQPVQITLRNDGNATHDFRLTQGVARPVHVVAKRGESQTATFTVSRPGTYTFICSQFGHDMAGMKGTITAQ
jgi:plastocyanin